MAYTQQTAYDYTHKALVEGMIANQVPHTILSRTVEGAAGIGFGKPAVRGTGDRQIEDAKAGGKLVGITVLDKTHEADLYPEFAEAAVMVKGAVAVVAGVAVAAGDPVYWVEADGTFHNAAAAGRQAIANAVYDTSADAGDLAVVRLG